MDEKIVIVTLGGIDDDIYLNVDLQVESKKVSFSIEPKKLKKIYKHFEKKCLRGDDYETHGKIEKLKEKIHHKYCPNIYPILPKVPFRKNDHSLESYRRKMDDFFNEIFLDFTFFFGENEFLEAVEISDESKKFLLDFIEERASIQFNELLEHSGCDSSFPEDPSSCFENIGWLIKTEQCIRQQEIIYNDRTELFESYLDDWVDGNYKISDEIKDRYIVLLIPGLFTGFYSTLAGYFYDNIAALEKLGITAMKLDEIDTFSSIHSNCIVIEKKVKSLLAMEEHKSKKIIFFGHSKGGTDCISALCLKENNLAASGLIAGCICVQAPIGGTPFAKKIKFLRSVKGVRAVNDLNYLERKRFIDLHPLNIIKENNIPVLCIVSEMIEPTGWLQKNIKLLQVHSKINCDGLVVPIDAIIPDSDVVTLQGIDHANTVFSRLRICIEDERKSPGSLTIAAFRLILDAINNK